MADGIVGINGRPLTSAKTNESKQSDQATTLGKDDLNASVKDVPTDRVELSAEATQELDRAGFDAEKVERIKQALADGNYPVDAGRIAEGFREFEKLL